MKKRRSIWLILITILVVGGFLFRAPLLKGGTRLVLLQLLHLKENQLSFADCFLQQGKIIITDLKVNSGYQLKIDRSEISFSHPLKGFSLAPYLLIQAPELTIDPLLVSTEQKKRIAQEMFFSGLEIQAGELYLKGMQQPYFFNFEMSKEKGKVGTFTLSTKPNQATPSIIADLMVEKKNIQVSLKIHALQVEKLHDLLDFLYPPLSAHVQQMKGEIQGEGDLFFRKGKLDRFEFSLDAHQIAFPELFPHVALEAEHFHGEFRYPIENKQKEALPFWKCFAAFGRLQGCSMLISLPEMQECGLTEMEVDLCFDPDTEPEIDVKGILLRQGLAHPLHLRGKGEMHPDKTFWIDLGLNLDNLDTFNHFLSICSAEEKKYLIQAEFENLDREDVRLLQEFLSPYFSPLNKISVLNGLFRGKVMGWVEEGKFTRFDVNNLEGFGVEFQNLSPHFKEIRGNIFTSFRCDLKDGFELKTFDLKMEKGSSLGIDIGQKKTLAFNDLALQFNWTNGDIFSQLSATVAGMHCELSLAGTEELLKGSCQLDMIQGSFKGEPGAKAFITLEKGLEEWKADGKVEWLSPTETPLVAFHLLFDENLTLEHLKEGWFESNLLSEHVYQPLLRWIDPTLKINGLMTLCGHFDQESLQIEPEAEALNVENAWFEAHSLKCDKGTIFSYDLKEKSFRCVIPLHQVNLVEKKYALHFDHLEGLLIHENGILMIQDMKGCVEGIDFIGAFHLNLSSGILSFNTHEFKGTIKDTTRLLKYLNLKLHIPEGLQGIVQGQKNSFRLLVSPNDFSHPVDVKLCCDVMQTSFPLSSHAHIENLSMHLSWDRALSDLSCTNLFGDLLINGKSYQLFLPYLYFHPQQDSFLEGSLRVEEEKGEIISLAVKAKKRETISLIFDRQATHFFNSRLNIAQCELSPSFELISCDLYPQLTLSSLEEGYTFLKELQFIKPLDAYWSWLKPHLPHSVTSHLFFDRFKEKLLIDATSESDNWKLSLKKEGGEWHLEKFDNGQFSASASIQEGEKKALLSNAKLSWQGGELTIEGGLFCDHELKALVQSFHGNLNSLLSFDKSFLPLNPYFTASGELKVLFQDQMRIEGHIFQMKSDALKSELPGWECESVCFFNYLPFAHTFQLSEAHLKIHDGSLDQYHWKKVQGIFNFSHSPREWEIKARLKDTQCTWKDLTCTIDQMTVHGEESEVKGESTLLFQTFPLTLSFSAPKSSTLSVTVKDKESDMKLDFQKDKNFKITKIEGSACGISCLLEEQGKDLKGWIEFDFNTVGFFLPKTYQSAFSRLKMGAGYRFEGLIDPLSFAVQGSILGNDFELLSCKFDKMRARVQVNSLFFHLKELSFTDPSLTISVPQLSIYQPKTGEWRLELPYSQIRQFQPSLLKIKGENWAIGMKDMVIDEMILSNVHGNLADPNSFLGSGGFIFSTKEKKGFKLLHIPKEFISHLGLDSSLYVPARGEVSCQIKEGKLFFTELKNAYSEGKKSEFFLTAASSLDFDGNLFIDLKMKQYVTLKLIEPLKIKVRGKLDQPTYAICK